MRNIMINPLFKILNYFITPYTLYWTAAATVVASKVASDRAKKSAGQAADVQRRASDEAIAEQQRQFDVSREQAEPFRQAGLGALSEQQALLGLAGTRAKREALQRFQESPGQVFLRERGEQAILRGASATGGLGGARVQEALQQQGIGLAQQDLQNQLARLSALSGQSQAVTSNIAGLGAQTAGNVGNLLQSGGQAAASGILGAQQARAQFTGQIGSALAGGAQGEQTPGVGFQRGFTAGLARF